MRQISAAPSGLVGECAFPALKRRAILRIPLGLKAGLLFAVVPQNASNDKAQGGGWRIPANSNAPRFAELILATKPAARSLRLLRLRQVFFDEPLIALRREQVRDRKSTRLNSSH